VVVMYAGKVAEEADTVELFSRMRHPYSEALLESVPKLDRSPADRLLSISGLPPDLSQTITNCRFAPRCQYATDQCRAEDPPLEDVAGGTAHHRFACFHPVSHQLTVAATVVGAAEDPRLEARRQEVSALPEILRVDGLVKEFPVLGGGVIRRIRGPRRARARRRRIAHAPA